MKKGSSVRGSCSLRSSTLEKYPNKYFIETGTYKGGGIKAAQRAGFKNIISIEINTKFYEYTYNRYKSVPGIEIWLGDSAELLPIVLQNIEEPATIFLDAHRLRTEEFTGQSPLIQELGAIKNHHVRTHTIIVDDMHKADAGISDWEGVSTLEIIYKLKEINPDYLLEYADGGGVWGRQLVARMENDTSL
jgi:hypothetical protein